MGKQAAPVTVSGCTQGSFFYFFFGELIKNVQCINDIEDIKYVFFFSGRI